MTRAEEATGVLLRQVWGWGPDPPGPNPRFLPSLVVVQVSKQHVLGDGSGQRRHGLVVLGDDLQEKPNKVRPAGVPSRQRGAGARASLSGQLPEAPDQAAGPCGQATLQAPCNVTCVIIFFLIKK